MRITVLIVYFTLITSFNLFALEWPAIGGVLKESFGQKSSSGVVRRDIKISGFDDLKVRAVDNGDVIFVRTKDQSFLPSANSDTIALDHKENLRSIYTNLENITIQSNKITIDDTWATAKKNGLEREFDVALYDNEKRQFVNPLVFIANVFSPKPSFIRMVYLRYENGEEVVLKNGMNIKSGIAEVCIDAYQYYMNGRYNLLPYAFRLEFMGDLIQDVKFDAINTNKGMAYLVGLANIFLKDLFTDNNLIKFSKIQLVPGQANFSIKILDINAASIVSNYSVNVN